MDNPETLATRRGNKEWTIQRHWQHEGAIKNGQSRDTDNIRYTITRHGTKTNKAQKHNTTQNTNREETWWRQLLQKGRQSEEKHDDASCSRRVSSQRRNMVTPVAPEWQAVRGGTWWHQLLQKGRQSEEKQGDASCSRRVGSSDSYNTFAVHVVVSFIYS
jgi:hypothetical protein